MSHPLENYRAIADIDYLNIKEAAFYRRYDPDFPAGIMAVNKDKQEIHIAYESGEVDILSFSSYLASEYRQLENEVRSNIEKECQSFKSSEQQKRFIQRTLKELQQQQRTIENLKVEKKQTIHAIFLKDKISSFTVSLQELFQENISASIKLKWLGKDNVLTTLFNDLIKHGLIEEPNSRKELAKFLLDNFIIEDGDSFSFDSIYTNVRKSKADEKRAKNAIDIKPYKKTN